MQLLTPRNVVFGSTLAAGLVADQVTKRWVEANLEVGIDEIHVIRNWLSIVHAQNTGAAFSTMEGQLPLFLVFTVIAVIVIGDLLRRQPHDLRMVPFSLGLILAGALGNGVDRVRQGYVTDFVKCYAGEEPLRSMLVESPLGTNVWPIWNVADALLLIGVAVFGLYWLLLGESEVPAEDDDEAREAAS